MSRLLTTLCALGFLLSSVSVAAQGIPTPDPKAPENKPAVKPTKKDKGWLGIGLELIPEEEASKRGYKHGLVKITSIFGGSPAEASGFEPEDVILEVDGTTIKANRELINIIGGHAPGDKVKVTILRGKETHQVPLILGTHPGKRGLLRSRFIDKPAPSFTVRDASTNEALSLADLKGKVVVVDFWATWCGPCRASIPKLNDLSTTWKDKGVVVVGISDEERPTLQRFQKKTDFAYTVAYDTRRKANKDYFVTALPTLFVIDQEGVVRDVHIGAGKFEKLHELVKELTSKGKKQ